MQPKSDVGANLLQTASIWSRHDTLFSKNPATLATGLALLLLAVHDLFRWAQGGNSRAAGLETAEPVARSPILGTNAPGANALAEPTRARRAAVLRIL